MLRKAYPDSAFFPAYLDPLIVNATMSPGPEKPYFTEELWCIKRKYKKRPAIYIRRFRLIMPGLLGCIPRVRNNGLTEFWRVEKCCQQKQ